MPEKPHKEMDSLKSDIENLREQIAALSSSMKKLAEKKPAKPQTEEGAQEPGSHKSFVESLQGMDIIAELQGKFEEARVRGEKAIKDLTAEIEKRPVASLVAAFGLGFIIAKLWTRENKS